MHLLSTPVSWLARLAALALCAAVTAMAHAQGQPSASFETERHVYTAGGQVRPARPVPGDYVAAGGRIVIDQRIGGDAMLVGGSIDVRAPIGDDLRAAGGDVNVDGTVGGELFAAGANITLARSAVIARSARIHGANISVEGRIEGGLKGSADKVTINGEVRGDVDVAAAQVELGPAAKIGGALRYSSAAELKPAEGATVGGAVTRESESRRSNPGRHGDEPRMHGERRVGGWVGGLLSYLGLLACGALLMLVAPVFSSEAPDRIRAMPWVSLGIGFATVIAAPVLAVLLFVTLLGIPLGFIVLALYPVLMLAGFLVGTLFIARLMPGALRQQAPAGFKNVIGYFALALLMVLLLARLPLAGGILLAFVTFAGIGACAVELYGRRKAAPPLPPVAVAL
jgi:cytoskeletal protein CcmA (bactofilin family)